MKYFTQANAMRDQNSLYLPNKASFSYIFLHEKMSFVTKASMNRVFKYSGGCPYFHEIILIFLHRNPKKSIFHTLSEQKCDFQYKKFKLKISSFYHVFFGHPVA